MRRAYSSILTLAALVIVLWLIWSRLHIVVWVAVPWWGLLIGALLLFLAFDYLLHQVFARR
ncbi:hypothetical protein EKD04_018415 [Chloroflexales bacterium ZM16-3]|nr:hypothetical protein [Chloroflexales bacterium ZM16-3]